MRIRLLTVFSSAALLGGCSSAPEPAPAQPERPGIVGRMWGSTVNAGRRLNPFDGDLKPRQMKERRPLNLKSLSVDIVVDPPAPKLGEQRQMIVSVRLTNKGHRLVQLDFPTTQRVDLFLKDKSGKILEHWADDQKFENESGLVAINPGERIEYNLNVSTREMTAGSEFMIEALFPRYEPLRATTKVVPTQ
jgi:hypothetical protein